MMKSELKKILENHKKWLFSAPDGLRADLSGVDLRYSNLSDVDLRYADLRGANLGGANLGGANLSGVNLGGANLRGANLRDIKANHATSFYHLQCPEDGSFIGYKRANNCIVKLLIPEDALRGSATSRKCRTNKAKVLEITKLLDGETTKQVPSDYDRNFVYKVGEIVVVDDFDTDRWNECSTGIHFFITKQEAIDYV